MINDLIKTIFNTELLIRSLMNSIWCPNQSWWRTDVDTQTLGLYLRDISNFMSPKMVCFWLKIALLTFILNLKMTNETFCKTVGKDVQVFCWPIYISIWAVALVPENIVGREFWSICYQNHQREGLFYSMSYNYIEMHC